MTERSPRADQRRLARSLIDRASYGTSDARAKHAALLQGVQRWVHPRMRYDLLKRNCAHYVHALVAPFGVDCMVGSSVSLAVPACPCRDEEACHASEGVLDRFFAAKVRSADLETILAWLEADEPFALHVVRFEKPPNLHVALLLEMTGGESRFASWGVWPELTLTSASAVWNTVDADTRSLAKRMLTGAAVSGAAAATGLITSGLLFATGVGAAMGAVNHVRKKRPLPSALAAPQPKLTVCFPDVLVGLMARRPKAWLGDNFLERERTVVQASILSSASSSPEHGNELLSFGARQRSGATLRDRLRAHLEAVQRVAHVEPPSEAAS